MTASRLTLYNQALVMIGARSLASLTENRESRRVLDSIWNDGAVEYCLQQGFWKWSIRTQEMTYDPTFEAEFGFRYAFEQPDDYVKLYSICSDENFDSPIIRYADESGRWYCDFDTIYVQYISNDNDFGYNYSLWPETFTKLVQSYLAVESCERLTQSASKKERLAKDYKKALIDARSKDAMNNPVKFMHPGSWSSARNRGRWGNFNAVLPST